MIRYVVGAEIALEALTDLYNSVEWLVYTRDADKMAGLLPGSLWHLSAWEDDRLVGLLRAVGDWVSIVYIQDILVRPDHQRRGIGRELLQRALDRYAHIRQVVLMTDSEEKTLSFYRSVGMSPVQDVDCTAFMRVNHKG